MKNKMLKYLFFLFVLSPFFGFAQNANSLLVTEFPESWVGDWAGELQVFNKEGMSQSLPMQLNIHPIEGSSDYSYTIVYGVDVEQGARKYLLKTIDAGIGHYAIDEQNSIQIDAYLFGEKLVQRFEVMGNLLDTYIEKRGDTLVWEVFLGKHLETNITGDTVQEGEDIPPVKTFPLSVYQKCILSLVE